jgi:hypothetical protein
MTITRNQALKMLDEAFAAQMSNLLNIAVGYISGKETDEEAKGQVRRSIEALRKAHSLFQFEIEVQFPEVKIAPVNYAP